MILGAVGAAAWLGLLWYAAPLAGGDEHGPADRVAGLLVVGVLTPLVLGFVHLLDAPALFTAAIALCTVRRLRSSTRPPVAATSLQDRAALAIVVFTVVAVAWPPLVRPLLEGDSLSYHLPNAASWVQSGSLWVASTRYWWSPGGSEIFAAGLYAVSGAFSLGLCGTLATLLLGLRIVAWGRRCDVPPLLAATVATATIATLTVGLQAGNLENDVWLGALFVELLYDARFAPRKLAGDASVCALVKPDGWAFALYGVIAARRWNRALLLPAAIFAAWITRDAILWQHALIPPGSLAFPVLFLTTVAGNGLHAVLEFVRQVALDGGWPLALVVAPVIGAFVLRDRGLCAAAIVALIVYMFLPLSYRTATAQLVGGHSLRYALPAFATGAIVAMQLLRRAAPIAVPLLALSTLIGLYRIASIFWIDPLTHEALLAAAALGLGVAFVRAGIGRLVVAAVAAMLIVAANVSAERHALARYDELLAPATSHFFDWLATRRPPRVVVSDIPAGAVVVVSPTTRAYDVLDPIPCDEARKLEALLAFRRVAPVEKTIFPSAQRQFAHCGTALYEDAAVRVVQPGV